MSLWETFRKQKHDLTGRTPTSKRQRRQRKMQELDDDEQVQRKTPSQLFLTTPSLGSSAQVVSNCQQKRSPSSKCRFVTCHHLVDEEISNAEAAYRSGRLGSYENPWKQQQRRIRRNKLGLSLAHKKLLHNDLNDPTHKDCYEDGSHAIYRKREDYSGSQMYTGCIFLNEHDRILAADVSGKMDIIKVPPFQNGIHYGKVATRGRPLGKALLQEFQIIGFQGSQPNQSADSSSALKLQSLDNGNRFAVGMPNGNYCIIDTERCKSNTSMPSSATATTRATTTKLTYHMSLLPDLHGTTIEGPRRKYHRAWNNPHLSLTHMFKETSTNFIDPHNFRQVYGWDLNKPRVTSPISFGLHESASTHANTAMWDFWDSQSSSVLAAHVDAEHDCFSLWDSRLKPTVVIDASFGQSSSRGASQDHVTSCAFVSQYCLATSHVTWTPSSMSSLFADDSSSSVVEYLSNGRLHKKSSATTSSRIQMWDLRMLRAKRQPLSCIAVVPSFPQDTVLGGTPDQSFPVGAAATSKQLDGHELSILEIHSPKSHNTVSGHSQLLVTTDSYSHGLQYHLLEPVHGIITKTISDGQPHSGFMAVAPSQHAMVCSKANGSGHSLQVYNLLDSGGSLGRRHSNVALNSKSGTKRSHIGLLQTEGTKESRGVSFTPVVKDQLGLSTQLSCLAMNHSGTSILGGSIDGDLFLWRGG